MRNLIRGLTAATLLAILPIAANAAVFVSVSVGPPLLPVYVAPPMPGPGYVWVPGYWAWGGSDYYWVPGTWVLPPTVGLLWTPGYWGWSGGLYVWNAGYWGPHVGFYGGIDYGCGYLADGYHGGYWQGSTFVINNTVINQAVVDRVAFNGGAGGVVASATAEQLRAAHEHHVGMSQAQLRNEHMAAADKSLHASVNHGAPPVAATRQPGVFHGAAIVAARNAALAGAAAAGSVAAAHTAHRVEHKPVAREVAHNAHPAVAHQPAAHEQTHHAVTHEPSQRALARTEEHTATHASHPVAHESHPAAHESHPVAHESHLSAHESRPVSHAQATHPAHEAPAAHEAPVHLASASHESAHATHSSSEGSHSGTARPRNHGGEQGHGGQSSERRTDHGHSGTG